MFWYTKTMNPTITSSSNETVKLLRRLASSAKARRDEGAYIAEGANLVRSLLDADATPLMFVISESAYNNVEVAALIYDLTSKNTKQVVLIDSLFESVTTIHAAVGIVAVCALPTSDSISQLQTDAVLLEDVQDPGNLGTILRTASAAGIQTVVLSSQCASPWSPKALRAGMGAQFGLTIYENEEISRLVESATIPVYITTLSEKSVSLYDVDLHAQCAWIFGNEGQGVSEQLMNLANATHVSIPQVSSAVESLNVSAATAVCLYEQYRQRGL